MHAAVVAVAASLLLAPQGVWSAAVPNVQLYNGVEMPVLAFAAQVWDAPTCRNATASALQVGFRFIWSSTLVGADCQGAQRDAIATSGIPRSEIFLAGTVNTRSCTESSCYNDTLRDANSQFRVLGADLLDMLMLDYPSTSGCRAIREQWRAFEELYTARRVRTIAVSNFNEEQLKCVMSGGSTTVPAANQMPYHLGHGEDPVVATNARYGIVVQAYSPLGSGKLVHDSLCEEIGQAHSKSVTQVALKWILQHNVTIATQSTNPAHLREDLDLFDFTLSGEEMRQLDAHSETLLV